LREIRSAKALMIGVIAIQNAIWPAPIAIHMANSPSPLMTFPAGRARLRDAG
jgi:hypothetical protein